MEMEKDKTQIFNFFKKLTKVYDDAYIANGIVKNLCFFKQKQGEQPILEWLNSMEKERLDAVARAIRTIYIENNKTRRPFVSGGNFAINFDEIVGIIGKIYEKRK